MKLVFFGTAEFAVPALRLLHRHRTGDGDECRSPIVLVVSQPDRPAGRGLRLTPSPVKQAALELGLPVETPERSRDPEFVARLTGLELDALIVAAYGQILSQAVLDSAKRGGINLHGSILPKYRGAAPIQRAILDGETESGVTLMQMAKGMDTGDTIDVARTPIGADETYGQLQARLADLGGHLAAEWIDRIVTGNYPRIPQNDELATYAAKVTKEEAELKSGMDVSEAYRRFRAFTPAPGAFLRTKTGLIRIRQAGLGASSGEPGTLSAPDEIAFAGGSLKLIEIQPEGKKPMSLRDYANGMHLKVGSAL